MRETPDDDEREKERERRFAAKITILVLLLPEQLSKLNKNRLKRLQIKVGIVTRSGMMPSFPE